MRSPAKEYVVEAVCDRIRELMATEAIKKAYFQIEIDWEGLPIVNAQLFTYAPIKEKKE